MKTAAAQIIKFLKSKITNQWYLVKKREGQCTMWVCPIDVTTFDGHGQPKDWNYRNFLETNEYEDIFAAKLAHPYLGISVHDFYGVDNPFDALKLRMEEDGRREV